MCFFFPGWCLPFSLWFAPLSFSSERRRRRRRRRDIDKEEEEEEEEEEENPSKNSSCGSAFTACTEGRPSEENAFARPMIRKKTTVEMAERKRQLRREKEEENEERDKGKVKVASPGIATTLFSISTPREEKEGNKEEGGKEEKDNNNNSVVARIESGRSFSYAGEEIVSKERRREEDGEEEEEEEEEEGDEGEEGEEGEEDKRSKKEELRSEQILKELRNEGLLDSIQSSTAKYWKELAAKRKKTKKSFGNS
tara:strand:+ start:3969 stop:4727 length:759 start_codon:yes stop_codon:yes gene_type:complete